MIEIKDKSGNTILKPFITETAIHHAELMKSDYVKLSWLDDNKRTLDIGCYIEWKGEIYRLLAPYEPEQTDEITYKYEPQFQSKIMVWSNKPFFFLEKDNEGNIVNRETDWALTGSASNFMSAICSSIQDETGESYTYLVDTSLIGTQNLSFQSKDIFSALNDIAGAFDTEWWVEGNKIHLSKCQREEDELILEVGVNVNTPSVNQSKEGYYNRFYAFGSTRNVTDDYQGVATNYVVKKRLRLPQDTCKFGYKDTKEGLKPEEVSVKVLIFDDIYPSSSLAISDVRADLRDVIDGNGDKVQIGTDSEGNPIYDTYSVFYFKIPGFTFHNSKYDKDNNPDGMLLKDLQPSVHFEDQSLVGWEFELGYDDETKEFEIIKNTSTGVVVPNDILRPNDGDTIILFNIKMPDEYATAAEKKLEKALDEEIIRMSSDFNTRTMDSYPTEFQNVDMYVGRRVLYKNGDYTLSTRILSYEEHLDYPCQVNMTIGEQLIKGSSQELKEEVVSVNKNLEVIKALSDLSTSIQNSYSRTQEQVLKKLSDIAEMWYIDKSQDKTFQKIDSDKWILRTKYNVSSQKGISALGLGDISGSSGVGGLDEELMWLILGNSSQEQISRNHLVTALSGYATELFVAEQIGNLINGAPEAYNTLKKIADVLNSNIASIGDIVTTLDNKADKTVRLITGNGLEGGGTIDKNVNISIKQDIWDFINDLKNMFVYDKANNAIKALKDFYSVGGVSAQGYGIEGSGLVNYDRLDNWNDYSSSKATYALSAKLGYDNYSRINELKTGVVNQIDFSKIDSLYAVDNPDGTTDCGVYYVTKYGHIIGILNVYANSDNIIQELTTSLLLANGFLTLNSDTGVHCYSRFYNTSFEDLTDQVPLDTWSKWKEAGSEFNNGIITSWDGTIVENPTINEQSSAGMGKVILAKMSDEIMGFAWEVTASNGTKSYYSNWIEGNNYQGYSNYQDVPFNGIIPVEIKRSIFITPENGVYLCLNGREISNIGMMGENLPELIMSGNNARVDDSNADRVILALQAYNKDSGDIKDIELTISEASDEFAGVMSASDKQKLDGMPVYDIGNIEESSLDEVTDRGVYLYRVTGNPPVPAVSNYILFVTVYSKGRNLYIRQVRLNTESYSCAFSERKGIFITGSQGWTWTEWKDLINKNDTGIIIQ